MSLRGKTVLVTRAKEQARELSALIETHGGRPIELPLIAFEALEPSDELDEALSEIERFRWLLFTSANGVRFFMNYVKTRFPHMLPLNVPIAVVGEKTEAVLSSYGEKAALVPDDYTAEGLVEALQGKMKRGDRILLVRGNRGRKVINDAVAQIGATLVDVAIYKTVFPADAIDRFRQLLDRNETIDYVTFTSSSTVSHYATILKRLKIDRNQFRPKIACIGPIAAKTAESLGIHVDIVPDSYTIDALVKQLITDSEGGK